MNCKLCGCEFEFPEPNCPGCNTPAEVYKAKVQLPPAHGAVNDYPGILTEAEVGELCSMIGSFFRQTEVPIVIGIVNDTQPLGPSDYAFALYNHWGIGLEGIDRGVLILLSLEEKKVESEIGFGLESVLSEEKGDQIVHEEFIPYFKDGKFFDGLKAGVNAITNELLKRLPTLS